MGSPTSDAVLHRAFMAIVKSSSKNNTYKFALALFLLERASSAEPGRTLEAGYGDVARHFFKYYWSHACKSKLLHGPASQLPRVIGIIREEFRQDAYPQSFARLQQTHREAVDRCVDKIARECLHDVVPRFQRAGGNRRLFFEYQSTKYHDSAGNERLHLRSKIRIKPDAADFLKRHRAYLYSSVILEWVKFLEVRNFGTPNLIRKVEAGRAGARSQRRFMLLLKPFVERCFYCGEQLAFDTYTHVDHVLPFSYVGNSEMWNMVLACRECNCAKLDRLPPRRYVKNLCEQNLDHVCKMRELRDSLARLYYDRVGAPAGRTPAGEAGIMAERIGWHYKNAAVHGFQTMRKFPCR